MSEWCDEEEDEDALLTGPQVIDMIDAYVAVMPLTACVAPLRIYCLPDIQVKHSIVLTDLFADVPGNGAGSDYLAELIRLCDENNITLYTDADGPRSRDFYLARGFEVTEGRRDHQLVHFPSFEPDDPSHDF